MIVICINPFESHFVPTLKLVEYIKDYDDIIYMGFEESRIMVEDRGYSYITLSSCEDDMIKCLKRKHDYRGLSDIYLTLHKEMENVFRQIPNLKLILFHISRFDLFFLPAWKCGVRMISYNTNSGSIEMNWKIPPNTSSLTIHKRPSIQIMLTWLKRYVRKEVSLKRKKQYYPFADMDNIAKYNKLHWKFGIDGSYIDMPHIKLGPEEFEFCVRDEEYVYAGLCISNEIMEKYKKVKLKAQNRPIVYCSLGTKQKRYLKTEQFIRNVIDIFKEYTEWYLVISLGDIQRKELQVDIEENIILYGYVDQLTILQNASIIITHGGYGTIKECIANGVPLIVSPCCYDQHGNAERVVYHKIGLKNNLLKKNVFDYTPFAQQYEKRILKRQISEMLDNPMFKINLQNMLGKIENHDSKEEVLRYIKFHVDDL